MRRVEAAVATATPLEVHGIQVYGRAEHYEGTRVRPDLDACVMDEHTGPAARKPTGLVGPRRRERTSCVAWRPQSLRRHPLRCMALNVVDGLMWRQGHKSRSRWADVAPGTS